MKWLVSFFIGIYIFSTCYVPSFALTLKAEVSALQRIPQTFYGTWLVESELIETNNRKLFKKNARDVWEFTKVGDSVLLQNPKSGASAEISVDEFKNGIASFSRMTDDGNQKEYEYPVITMEGKRFEGVDTYIIETYENGELISKDVVKYKIRGRKITSY